jgi:hypothetical protein
VGGGNAAGLFAGAQIDVERDRHRERNRRENRLRNNSDQDLYERDARYAAVHAEQEFEQDDGSASYYPAGEAGAERVSKVALD